jgi:hypothetical protein
MEGMPARSTPSVSQKLRPLVSDAFSSTVSSDARARLSTMILLRMRSWVAIPYTTRF